MAPGASTCLPDLILRREGRQAVFLSPYAIESPPVFRGSCASWQVQFQRVTGTLAARRPPVLGVQPGSFKTALVKPGSSENARSFDSPSVNSKHARQVRDTSLGHIFSGD